MSAKAKTLDRLYKAGRLSADGVLSAVTLGWITPEEASLILQLEG